MQKVTGIDPAKHKVHEDHYRGFQNGPAFGRLLRDVHGFVPLLEQEGTGFSPYGSEEDPHLYRLIARRSWPRADATSAPNESEPERR